MPHQQQLFDELQSDWAEAIAGIDRQIADARGKVVGGMISQVEAEDQIFDFEALKSAAEHARGAF